MTTSTTFPARLAFATAAMMLVTPAIASVREPTSRSVSYADLDLSRDGDLRALHRRLDRAIRRLCGDANMARNGFELQQIRVCEAAARSDAEQQIAAAMADRGVRLSAEIAVRR